jgi:hypothetical protein
MPVTKENFEKVCEVWVPPDFDAEDKIDKVQMAAKWLVATILDNTPACADQQSAIRHVRTAVSEAVEALCLRGEV